MITNDEQYWATQEMVEHLEKHAEELATQPLWGGMTPEIRQAAIDAARLEAAKLREQMKAYATILTNKAALTNILVFYVIYDHPTDYPQHFVLRRQFVKPDPTMRVPPEIAPHGTIKTPDPRLEIDVHCTLSFDIDALRTLVPPGLTCMADPDPHIAEVWI